MRNHFLLLLVALFAAAPALAQPSPREERVGAVERLIGGEGDESLRAFAREHLTDGFRTSMPDDELLALLRELRERGAGFGGVGLMMHPSGRLHLKLMRDQGTLTVELGTDPEDDHRISHLAILGEQAAASVDPISWENLEERLAEESETWMGGTILIVRDGQEVLHQGYGHADVARTIPNDTQTVYAIGSVPIDFTHVAILQLVGAGKVSFDDPITRFFDDVPEDKRAITVQHLRRGASGLQNFHDRPSDWNYDLAWIDREEAMRRIFEGELLFPPGEGREHSHSAWGVLAAIVEIVSGQTYGEYVREHLFEPLGMHHTGLYEEIEGFGDCTVAEGHSPQGVGEVNAPTHWGKTSWLVMGSGGMVSTTGDMGRWIRGVRHGGILPEEMQDLYYGPKAMVGIAGNDRGFFSSYRLDPENFFVFLCNSHESMMDPTKALTDQLVGLFD